MKKDKKQILTEKCEEVAGLLKYLSHPQRMILLCWIADSPKTVGDLQELCGMSQSLTSQVLAKMKAEGLVSSRKDGKFVTYQIEDQRVAKIINSLNKIFCE